MEQKPLHYQFKNILLILIHEYSYAAKESYLTRGFFRNELRVWGQKNKAIPWAGSEDVNGFNIDIA